MSLLKHLIAELVRFMTWGGATSIASVINSSRSSERALARSRLLRLHCVPVSLMVSGRADIIITRSAMDN